MIYDLAWSHDKRKIWINDPIGYGTKILGSITHILSLVPAHMFAVAQLPCKSI